MPNRVDHVMICAPDLERGIDTYARLGFNVFRGGVHPGKGTHNAISFLQEDYLELLSIRDEREHIAAAAAPGSPDAGLRGG
ncbi:MAG TPA: VOC family protein [Candidatus Dormibacteraeota bacterium]|jgi:hypothetical protein|nr:VOC family protein [Candidatus Dormibacteraeota bacterium]